MSEVRVNLEAGTHDDQDGPSSDPVQSPRSEASSSDPQG